MAPEALAVLGATAAAKPGTAVLVASAASVAPAETEGLALQVLKECLAGPAGVGAETAAPVAQGAVAGRVVMQASPTGRGWTVWQVLAEAVVQAELLGYRATVVPVRPAAPPVRHRATVAPGGMVAMLVQSVPVVQVAWLGLVMVVRSD